MSMRRVVGTIGVLVLVSLCIFAVNARAQTAATSGVLGTVTDPSGASVVGAQVQIKNDATGEIHTQSTNASGQYLFPAVSPGTFTITVTKEGFQTITVPNFVVNVAKSYTFDAKLLVGAVSQTVEVQATATAELQTTDAQVGSVADRTQIARLPTLQHNAAELLNVQPAVQQSTGGAIRAAGAIDDQNTVILDGIDISDELVGTVTNNFIPIPIDSVEEFRVGVSNGDASYGRSTGAQVALVGRRGSNDFHGAVYWYHQNSFFNANTWTNNRSGIPLPLLHDNRGGMRIGGPIRHNKDFFFANYEIRRFPQTVNIVRTVPSTLLRQGIVQFLDQNGALQQFNLKTSTLCGSGGNLPCDPRALGVSPTIAADWALLPPGTDTTVGDGLNTLGFRSFVTAPINTDYIVFRYDHNFNDKWQFHGSYTYYKQLTTSTGQLNIINGKVVSAAVAPVRGDGPTASIVGQITPSLLNTFRFGKIRNRNASNLESPTASATQLALPGTNTSSGYVALNVADVTGGSPGLASPIDNTASGARFQSANEETDQFSDDLAWLKGSHNFEFGTTIRVLPFTHVRADKVFGSGITSLIAVVDADGSNLFISPTDRPPTCTVAAPTNCIKSGDVQKYDELYAGALGMVDNVGILATRDGSLNPLPFGTFLTNVTRQSDFEFYAQDTWRLKPNLTVTYGLQYGFSTAPTEQLGRQTVPVYAATGAEINGPDYLTQKMNAAAAGQIFNPTIGFEPVKSGNLSVFHADYKDFSPRLSAAWTPRASGGFLKRLFGNDKTVIRAGFGMYSDRLNTVEDVEIPMLGVGFGNIITVSNPACNVNGAAAGAGCNASAVNDPGSSQYRVGVDGNIPVPTRPAVTVPVTPAAVSTPTGSFGETISFQFDPNYHAARTKNVDITIQRQLPGDMILELGYIGSWGSRLPESINLNQSPYMFLDKASNQTFAQAYDAVAQQLRAGTAVAALTTQPWFENQLNGIQTAGGAGKVGCTAAANATQCLASLPGLSSAFVNGGVSAIFQTMNIVRSTELGLPAYNNMQIQEDVLRTYIGRSDYQGFIASLHKRTSHGVTFDVNYTYSKSLDQNTQNQNNANYFANNFFPDAVYGPSTFDRTHVLAGNFVYDLPFGGNHALHLSKGWADRFISGWYTSGLVTAASGFPLTVTETGSPFGGGFGQSIVLGAAAIPTVDPATLNSTINGGVAGSGGIGTQGNPASKGSGLNIFQNPAAVFADFRYVNLTNDGRDGHGNALRGLPFWNVDQAFGKATQINERFKVDFSFELLNIFNHPNFATPSLSLTSPSSFGVISTQLTPANRTSGARWVELGLRIEF